MASKQDIKTVAARSKLEARREPHWHRVSEGAYLGYRVMTVGKPGSWVARYRDRGTGKQVTKSLGDFSEHPDSKRYDLASAAAVEWFTHLGRGGSVKSYTVAEAAEEFAAHTLSEHGEASAKDMRQRVDRLVLATKLAKLQLEDLIPGHLNAWRKDQLQPSKVTGRPKAKSTVNRDMATLRAILNHAYRLGWVTSDHAWKLPLAPLKGASQRRTVYLPLEDRKRLVEHCPADLAPLVRCLTLLPLRPGVPASLKVGDFDPRQGLLKISKDKAGKGRHLPLPASVVEFFRAQAKGKLPTASLFSRADGTPWNKDAWKKHVKAAVKAAGLPEKSVLYSLRHSTITDLIVGGLDPLTVATLSGTSVMMIQKHYGQLIDSRARDGLSILAA